MAYQSRKKGKWTVMIAQTGPGWNVATFTVKNNRVFTKKQKNVRTLAEAKKEFTRQFKSI